MDRIQIIGGNPLNGEVKISGAKNSALPIMAASLLTDELLSISNIPNLTDINSMLKLLESLNVSVSKKNNKINFKSNIPLSLCASYELVRRMRASFLILGPLLARYGDASVSLPGGCAIGTRPVDLHLDGFKKMGVKFKINSGYISGNCNGRLKGSVIKLKRISVGATENLMMAATLAEGDTIIKNSAREPEVVDLAKLLIKMGADIEGHGTKVIRIAGKKKLNGCDFTIMPDRIESGTFILCVFGCSGQIKLLNLNRSICKHLQNIFKPLTSLSLIIKDGGKSLLVKKNQETKVILKVKTKEYPGFPTDLQAQLTSSLLKTSGESEIQENIFENRFMHISELIRMGANLKQNGSTVTVCKTNNLRGAEVMATDLRASSSLIIAGLMANGKTTINRVYHLDRGYEEIEKKLEKCGAKIKRIKK